MAQFSFAYAATTNLLKPCHAAAGGSQVSGTCPQDTGDTSPAGAEEPN